MTDLNSSLPGFEPDSDEHAAILFDGVCNLCNSFVNFVIDRDPDGYFRFCSLQSECAEPYLQKFGISSELEYLAVIESGKVYVRSEAALRIFHHLRAPWNLFSILYIIPKSVRDRIYKIVAHRRYDWFGKRDECRRPTPEVREKFI